MAGAPGTPAAVEPRPAATAATPSDESAQLRTIVSCMADGVVVVARDGTVRFANPAAEVLFGRTGAALVGAPFGFPVQSAGTQEIDVLRPDPTRGAAALEVRAAQVRVVDTVWDGEPVALVSLRDVTEQNAAHERERRLAEAEAARAAAERSAALLRAVFESMPDAVFAGGPEGITAANGPALVQLGFPTLADFNGEGASLADALQMRDPATGRPLDGEEEPVARVLREGTTLTRDLLVRHRGRGEDRVVRCSAAPVRDAAGRVIGAVAIHADVTLERQRGAEREQLLAAAEAARVEAEAANQVKAEFLAVMSHELRTPLNAIGGYAELLELGIRGTLTEQQRQDIARIQQSQRHLLELVNEVLDLAKADAGELQVDRTAVRAADAVDAALALVRPQASARSIALDEAGGDALGLNCLGDEPRIRQVLVNLLANAVKFTPAGGRVTVSGRLTDSPPSASALAPGQPYLALRVADTGIGIAPDQLARIFEPFTQAQGGLTRSRDGIGLGLAISRRLARLMGGDLTVESTVGAGSAFTLWLPTPERRVRARTASTHAGPERRTPAASPVICAAGVARIGAALLPEVDQVVRAWVVHLRADPEIRGAASLPQYALEDHASTFVTDVALVLRTMGDAEGDPSIQLRDGTAILALVAERHGAQRARLQWSEAAIRREYALLGELLDATVRRLGATAADPPAVARACVIVQQLLEQAARRSLAGYRLAVGAPAGAPPAASRRTTPR